MASRDRVVAIFERADRLVAAVRAVRARGFAVRDVYAPYALHELDDALGVRRSRLGLVTFAGGVAGAVGAIGMQVWCAALDWPVDVGGKPANSALAFLPITFELTVLLAGLATAGAFLARSRLFPGAASTLAAEGVTNDRFALLAEGAYGEVLGAVLHAAGASEVRHLEPAGRKGKR